jgi:hypothetical protein
MVSDMKRATVLLHFMPWEIDYCIETFTQLRRTKYFLPDGFDVHVKTVLNLSSALIDWDLSKIPKSYFIEKFMTFSGLLNVYGGCVEVYDGDQNFGHIDWQRKVYEDDSDYYLQVCPDIYFSEHLIPLMLQSTEVITNDYFLLTPQICTLWDSSWDVLVNKEIGTLPYNQWHLQREISDIDAFLHRTDNNVFVRESPTLKWAGWFDLSNKGFVEKIASIPNEWGGYGAWDLYTMIVSDAAMKRGYDFKQYILDGQIIFPREVGVFANSMGYTKYYRDFIEHKDLTEQRLNFNARMNESLNKKLSQL